MAEQTPPKKKKRTHNPVKDYLVYLGIRVLGIAVHMFDVEMNLRTARFFGQLMWKYYHRGRIRALDNLRASFPEKSEEWIHRTGKRSFEQLAMFVMELVFVPRLV